MNEFRGGSTFRNKKVRVKIYRIDRKTSNYHANINNCNLQLVDNQIIRQKRTYSASLHLEPNTLQLIIIEPSNTM
jgi:hypothetical protein